MDRKSFQTAFGSVYEHSPWVADEVYESRLDTSPCNREQYADYLCGRFESVFTASGNERQLETLRAHPELACARSKQRKLTADSVSEQRGGRVLTSAPSRNLKNLHDSIWLTGTSLIFPL